MEEDNDAPSQPVRSRGWKAQRNDNQPRNGNNQPSWAKRRRKSQDGDAIPTGSSFTGHAGVELPPETAYDCKTWRNTTAEGIKSIVDPCLKEGGKKPDYETMSNNLGKGIEAFYTAVNEELKEYLRPQEAPVTIIQDMCWEFLCNFPIMSNEANIRMLKDRSYNAFDGDKHVDVYETRAPTPTAVSIIAGESGGGKTVEAIASVCRGCLPGECLRFYCLARDLSEGITGIDTSLNIKDAKTKRNKQCVENLKTAMSQCYSKNKKAYDFLTGIKAATGAECTLGIVVDEAGDHPQVVRALCSISSDLGKELGLKENVTVQVVVAGTGVGSSDLPPGSSACSYNVVVLSTSDAYWKHISKGINTKVIDCISCHERAPLMIRNPRFARVLLSAIESVSTETVAIFSDKTARDFVNLWLAQAASKFKSLNGLSNVKSYNVLGELGSALRIALLGNTPPTKAPETTQGEHDPAAKRFSTFITNYGMVVDNANWVKKNDHKPNVEDVWATETIGENRHLLVSAKGKRFSLSLAHSSILLVLLELVPRRSSLTGESLESCVASLFPVLISAFRSRTVGEMLKALQITAECASNTIIPDSMVVWSKQYQKQGKGVLNDFSPFLAFTNTDAYVVTNGPKYPFADIVVLIPKTVMILIQCKDYGSSLALSKVKEELAKMFHPKHTLEPKQYVEVVKTQEQLDAMTPGEIFSLKDDEKKEREKATNILEQNNTKVSAIKSLRDHFGITEVVYAFVGSNADVMKNARLAYLKDPKYTSESSHIVCFGGLSGVTKEPLKSIIAFDDTKAKDVLTQPVGTLGTQTSLSE